MKTQFEKITHWMQINEWKSIKESFASATTLERCYNIVRYVNEHKSTNHKYREKILGEPEFIQKFGHLDLEYLKYATKTMNKKCNF